jgi:ABC-type antimicrobial peptide transport system permease subunit
MFGWDKSVGKTIKSTNKSSSFIVAGVIQDVYNLLPTVPVQPVIAGDMNKIINFPQMDFSSHEYIIKYREGMWKSCRSKIEAILKEAYPNKPPRIENAEEEYATYVKSETSMITLLSFVSLVCVIISIFGLFSMISLSCEKRRKEIAIRKIHGATITDIINIYIREYSLLLIAGAIVAFPAGYLVMKRWIEQYVKQTDISAWIYVSIILLLIIVIVVCVGRKVYRTSRENPSEAVK